MKAWLPAGAAYFGWVFGVGVMLGSLRVPLLVPRLGERWAELLEMPLMGLAIVLAARWVLRHFALAPHAGLRLAVGGFALLLMVGAEGLLAVTLQDRSLAQYLGSRDPVSGAVYLAMLLVFALMPWWLGRRPGAR